MITARISQRTSTSTQLDLLRHMMTLDNQCYHVNPHGALMHRVVGDTGAVQGIWRTLVGGIGRDIVSLSLADLAVHRGGHINPWWTFLPWSGRRKSRQLREKSGTARPGSARFSTASRR